MISISSQNWMHLPVLMQNDTASVVELQRIDLSHHDAIQRQKNLGELKLHGECLASPWAVKIIRMDRHVSGGPSVNLGETSS
mmetsp:Transcript_498/g.1161  ORF Transcript_498/g.1161 Transcript_498/m.1161 type:complete len:82 (+) Transcript_498:958-1203(+)